MLRQRYDELCARKSFLPYEFNLRLPEGLDLDDIISQLPDDFFSNPPPPEQAPDPKQPNRVALALAIQGWQGLTNPRIGAVPNSASCHTCVRRLGLWMFKSKEVGPDGEVLVPAPMDHLDPVREHRFFCPWKSGEAQRLGSSKSNADSDMPAWKVLVQAVKNDAHLRSALQDKPKNRGRPSRYRDGPSAPSAPRREAGALPSTPGNADTGDGGLASPVIFAPEDDEDDERAKEAKDKERWARLRKVKSLFDTKGGKKLRRTLSRPGTSHSTVSGGGGE
jgi:hypothetical protein